MAMLNYQRVMVLKGMYNQRSQQQPDVHPTSKELPVTWTTYGLRMGYKPFTDWDAQPSIKWMGYTQPYRILMVHYNIHIYIYIYRIYIYICVCVCKWDITLTNTWRCVSQ